MRHEFLEGKRRHRVDVEDLGDGRHRVQWALVGEGGQLEEQQSLLLDVREVADGRYSVLSGNDVHDVGVERDGDRRTIELADGTVVLEWQDPLRRAGSGRRGPAGPATVTTPIPGRVVRVPVSVGDDVVEGQAVIVVEAMKMANELRSPIAGRVTAVSARAGDTVDAGAKLVTIEPLPAEA